MVGYVDYRFLSGGTLFERTFIVEPNEKFSAPETTEHTDTEFNFEVIGSGTYEITANALQIEEVSFSGNAGEHYTLKNDDLSKTYDAPHWKKSDGSNEPVAYKRGSVPKVEALFDFNVPDELLSKLELKGVGVGIGVQGFEFEKQPLVKDEKSGLLMYKEKSASEALPNTIKFYDRDDETAFKIDWQLSIDGGAFVSIGETKHRVYLTWAAPVTTLRQETLFHIGCKMLMAKQSKQQL